MAKLTLPSLLSLTGAIDPSHAAMSGSKGFTDKGNLIAIQSRTVLGTLGSAAELKKIKADTAPSGNPQKVDGCFLRMDQDTLHVEGTVRISNMIDMTNCNDSQVLNKIREYYGDSQNEQYFAEIAYRTLIQFAKGAPLHRNGRSKEIRLRLSCEESDVSFKVDPRANFKSSLEGFDPDLTNIQDKIVKALTGGIDDILLLTYHYQVFLGDGQEVYPSEEFVEGSSDKVLFSLSNGQAGMHTQKIGNGLRAIDTWYEEDTNHNIPVDPFGPDKRFNLLRRGNKADSVYGHIEKMINDDGLSDAQHCYLIASLIRGGVYSSKA